MYNILITIDENYMQPAAVMLVSLFRNHQDIPFSIYVVKSLGLNIHIIEDLINAHGATCHVLEINNSDVNQFRISVHATVANYYRIFVGTILPESLERILYLDVDLIVRRNITALFDKPLNGYVIAAVENYGITIEKKLNLGLSAEDIYFNSGVLLINLKLWRELNITEQCVQYILHNPDLVEYWDQDALNAILVGRWQPLSPTYNMQTSYLKITGDIPNPHIVHFTGKSKPWQYMDKHPYKKQYLDYLKYTPWKTIRSDEATLGNWLRKKGMMPLWIEKILSK